MRLNIKFLVVLLFSQLVPSMIDRSFIKLSSFGYFGFTVASVFIGSGIFEWSWPIDECDCDNGEQR